MTTSEQIDKLRKELAELEKKQIQEQKEEQKKRLEEQESVLQVIISMIENFNKEYKTKLFLAEESVDPFESLFKGLYRI